VAHGDARRLALNRKVKLSAAACGAARGHRSAPWLWAECRLDFKTMRARQQMKPILIASRGGAIQSRWASASYEVPLAQASKRTTAATKIEPAGSERPAPGGQGEA
jgi:hypothetical protein